MAALGSALRFVIPTMSKRKKAKASGRPSQIYGVSRRRCRWTSGVAVGLPVFTMVILCAIVDILNRLQQVAPTA
jgi:hypothetical protein